MGGGDSEVTGTTRTIAVESAHFAPAQVRRTARRLGLATEASHRFERGADYDAAATGLARALELVALIGAGTPRPGWIDAQAQPPAPRPALTLRRARIARVLGYTIADATVERILTALGFAHRADPLRRRLDGHGAELARRRRRGSRPDRGTGPGRRLREDPGGLPAAGAAAAAARATAVARRPAADAGARRRFLRERHVLVHRPRRGAPLRRRCRRRRHRQPARRDDGRDAADAAGRPARLGRAQPPPRTEGRPPVRAGDDLPRPAPASIAPWRWRRWARHRRRTGAAPAAPPISTTRPARSARCAARSASTRCSRRARRRS